MNLAVVSCWDYRDCWNPFFWLLKQFWPSHPPTTLVTDQYVPGVIKIPDDIRVFSGKSKQTWCKTVADYAATLESATILMQDDFFLNSPVHGELVEEALEELHAQNAGCVRVYPAPGGILEYGNDHFAIVPRGTRYRISCMAAIWDPAYLKDIALKSMWTTGEAGDFENLGTPYSDTRPELVLGWKSEVKPWPMEYLCSAISRGKWNPEAIKLCADHGVPLDRSMRPVEA